MHDEKMNIEDDIKILEKKFDEYRVYGDERDLDDVECLNLWRRGGYRPLLVGVFDIPHEVSEHSHL